MTQPLVRYVAAATLARSADGGAAVGLVLLATTAGGVSRPSLVGGLLAACLTAPHLTGPVLARQLDRVGDGRRILAAAFAGYGLAIIAASCVFGRVPVLVVAGLVVLAGLCGPLLTGGLSSRLAALVGPDQRSQRRAQGWDSVSYGIGGSAGPAAVAALATVATAQVSMAMLGAAAILAAVLVLTLPAGDGPDVLIADVPSVRHTLRLIAVTGPLRRVMYATMVTALPAGAIAVLAVALGKHLATSPVSGTMLAAAYGLGNLFGSLLVTVFPLSGEPEKLVSRHTAIVGVTFGICAAVSSYPLAVVAFGLAGAANAPFFTATLAARSTYSPPGMRAQVFVSMAALKIAAAALGTAVAGALVNHGPRLLLLAGAMLTLAAAGVTVLDRKAQALSQ
jgi:MFS family permease